MRALVVVFAAALAGCFPTIGDGQVHCGLEGECPSPMRCNNGDGKCYGTLSGCVSLHCLVGWCGPISDGCGHMIDCGSCFPTGVDAGSGVKVDMRGAIADLGACSAPDPCTSGVCGSVTDSCGKARVCPDCTPAGRCSANKANQCACTPRTLASCAALGVQCGVYPDGCGGMLDCGACTMGHGNSNGNCGGGGPYVCGSNGNKCTPIKTCAAGVCGDIPDGCNAVFHCPTPCASGICGGGGVPNRCG